MNSRSCHGMGHIRRAPEGSTNDVLINSPEEGALALAMSVILCAVSDIKAELCPLESTRMDQRNRPPSRLTKNHLKARRILATQAAAFLQGENAGLWLDVLNACGVKVPMNRIWRELKQLKEVAA